MSQEQSKKGLLYLTEAAKILSDAAGVELEPRNILLMAQNNQIRLYWRIENRPIRKVEETPKLRSPYLLPYRFLDPKSRAYKKIKEGTTVAKLTSWGDKEKVFFVANQAKITSTTMPYIAYRALPVRIQEMNGYLWGKRYLMKVVREEQPPRIELLHKHMVLHVRPDANSDKCYDVVEQWYRDQLKQVAPKIISKWEPLLRVRVKGIYVQRMKTKWGSCTPSAKTIRLNTDLAKKPRQCLEYIIVHEMIHFIEPTHNARFVALMDKFLPRWRLLRQQLNNLPVRHENWFY